MNELAQSIEELSSSFSDFKESYDLKLDVLGDAAQRRMDILEGKMGLANSDLSGIPSHSADSEDAKTFFNMVGINAGVEAYNDYKAALDVYCRRGPSALSGNINNALSAGSDPGGGYLVTPDTSGRIVKKIYESSPIRQIASIQGISTDALEGLNDLNEPDSGWVGEKEDRTDTNTPDIGEWRIPVHEQYAMPKVTQKLLDDANYNVGGWLEEKIAEKFSRAENTAFVSGTGIGQPRGFLTYNTATTGDDTRAWGALQYIASGASGAFAGSDPADALYNLCFSVKSEYLANSVWVMNRSTMNDVAKLKDGNDNYLLSMGNIKDRTDFHLLGYPVVLAEDMPAIAADSLSIAFGSFKDAYQIVDRLGISLLRDPYTTKGWVKFYARKRVGGDLINSEAIKLMKFAAS